WAGVLREHGHEPGKFRPSARTRLLARLGRVFGPGFLLPMLLAEEGREVKGYLDMHRRTARGAAGSSESLTLARESAEHAATLNEISGRSGEPWHRTESGGLLRNVGYGFNDGLATRRTRWRRKSCAILSGCSTSTCEKGSGSASSTCHRSGKAG